MLETVGVSDEEILFSGIGAPDPGVDLPSGRSEAAVRREVEALLDDVRSEVCSFLGGGCYEHVIPAAVDALAERGEFLTAYTPYQPECSQGTLQALFEFQSAVCALTGMEVANASLYDGGTALVEGVMTALRVTRRRKVVVEAGVNPTYRDLLKTFTRSLDVALVVPPERGSLGPDDAALVEACDGETAAVVMQHPDFHGVVADRTGAIRRIHERGALAVMSVYPIALGLIKTPGEMGADIATAEGQSLGLPLNFGGPLLGLFAARRAFLRKMPGRIVGETLDRSGRRCFVNTLQAREQHIRREKATSNICTNAALCALRAGIFMSLLGPEGMAALARTNWDRAAYARRRLGGIPGVRVLGGGPFFNEFPLELPVDAEEAAGALLLEGYAAGIPLGRYDPRRRRVLLVAVTEARTREEIDGYADRMAAVLDRLTRSGGKAR